MIRTELAEKIPYEASLAAVQNVLRETLLDSDALISEMMRHLASSGGKNFRAMLLLAAATDNNGDVPRNAVISAAAVEILHMATLVHDDVIDDADVRRGKPSVQHRFGKKPAVICGDYLFCKCFLLAADLAASYQEHFLDIAKATTRICIGELRQYEHNGDISLQTREYFRIIAGKTAALFALALYAGTVVGGRGEKEARLLSRFGYYIGMAFQLKDDCLDYESGMENAKKSVRHDLGEGVITLPLIYALAKRPELRQAARECVNGSGGVDAILTAVQAIGGVTLAENVAERYCDKAEKLLRRLPEGKRSLILTEILGKIRMRRY